MTRDRDRLPPGQHLVSGWPVLHVGPIPRFDEEQWDFKVYGEVEHPVTFTYRQLKELPVERVTADFHCVTKFSVLDNQWEGVSFRTIIEMVAPLPSATHVIAHCDISYTSNLSLEVMDDDDVMVVWARNGEPLSPEHGFPLRLMVPKRYAWKSAKWLRALEFAAKDRRGFWEDRGYNNNADPWKEERYSYQE
ncbi:MAG: sulfite oxidase-like oxidoreductase [Actinomycetota bacterium]|nr:sulfite oxidase-like oxidoreductase [Actinomycetota bacterium]